MQKWIQHAKKFVELSTKLTIFRQTNILIKYYLKKNQNIKRLKKLDILKKIGYL
jgi:hypothetical protein